MTSRLFAFCGDLGVTKRDKKKCVLSRLLSRLCHAYMSRPVTLCHAYVTPLFSPQSLYLQGFRPYTAKRDMSRYIFKRPKRDILPPPYRGEGVRGPVFVRCFCHACSARKVTLKWPYADPEMTLEKLEMEMTGEEIKSIAMTFPEVMECALISQGGNDPEKAVERLATEGQSIAEAMELLATAGRRKTIAKRYTYSLKHSAEGCLPGGYISHPAFLVALLASEFKVVGMRGYYQTNISTATTDEWHRRKNGAGGGKRSHFSG